MKARRDKQTVDLSCFVGIAKYGPPGLTTTENIPQHLARVPHMNRYKLTVGYILPLISNKICTELNVIWRFHTNMLW